MGNTAANRRWYLRHKDEHKARVQRNNKRYRKDFYDLIGTLKSKPCADCGGTFPPCAMDFDHRHGKKHNVGNMHGWSKATVLEEISKCDVVCANCHRIRTQKRRSRGRVNQAPVS